MHFVRRTQQRQILRKLRSGQTRRIYRLHKLRMASRRRTERTEVLPRVRYTSVSVKCVQNVIYKGR